MWWWGYVCLTLCFMPWQGHSNSVTQTEAKNLLHLGTMFFMPSSLPLLHTAMPTPCLNTFSHSNPYISNQHPLQLPQWKSTWQQCQQCQPTKHHNVPSSPSLKFYIRINFSTSVRATTPSHGKLIYMYMDNVQCSCIIIWAAVLYAISHASFYT